MSTTPSIPGYTLGTELGRGGAGAVWSAVDDATGDPVAVKVFETDGPEAAAALLDEARRASAVDHPGVVRVRDQGRADGVAWIVMDLVPGPDLRRRVAECGPLPPAEAARVVADAAEVLAAVHAAGLVHRDVKPANILLDDTPGGLRVRLTDFGVAAPAAPGEGLSGASSWARTGGDPRPPAGTYAYMAPEQWRGAPACARTDVYGLGGVLYTALTGALPYPHDTLPELAYAVAVAPVPRAGALVPDLPPAYDAVIAATLAKDPRDRVPTAAGLAAALRAVADGRVPDLPRRSGRRAVRPALRAVAAAAVLAAAAAGTLAWHPWSASGTDTRPLRRVVCAEDLELRAGPRGAQTGLLHRGDGVSVLRRDTSQNWAYVRTGDGRRGWVLGTWLRPVCVGGSPG